MKIKIFLFVYDLLIQTMGRLIMATYRLLLIVLFKALMLLVRVIYLVIDAIIYLGSMVGVVITETETSEAEFSTDPRFTEDQLIAMAKATPKDIDTIEQISAYHSVSFRQARKVKNIIKNPPVNVNTYVSA